MSPLEEIHLFFETLRNREAPRYPDIPASFDEETKAFMEAGRETSRKHWAGRWCLMPAYCGGIGAFAGLWVAHRI